MDEIPDPSKVIAFTGAKKDPPSEERMLEAVPFASCQHGYGASYQVDLKAGKCFCTKCKGEVSPIFVLEQLMHLESQWMRTRAAYQDEMARLEARSSTKCQHCEKMTRISRS